MKKNITTALSVFIVVLLMFTVFKPARSFAQTGNEDKLEKVDGNSLKLKPVEGVPKVPDGSYYIVDISNAEYIAIKQANKFVLVWTESSNQADIITELKKYDNSVKSYDDKYFIFVSGDGKIYPYEGAPRTGSEIGDYFVSEGKFYIQQGKVSHYVIKTNPVPPTSEPPTSEPPTSTPPTTEVPTSQPPTTEVPTTTPPPTTEEPIDIPETDVPLTPPSNTPTTQVPTTDPGEELEDIEDEEIPLAGPDTGDAGMGGALVMGVLSLIGGVYVYKTKKR